MTRQLALVLGLIALAVVLAIVVPAQCQRIRSQAAQSRVDTAQAGALSNSAADAVGTVAAGKRHPRPSPDPTRRKSAMRRVLMLPLILLCATPGCAPFVAGPATVTASGAGCSSLIPEGWSQGVSPVDLPGGNVVADKKRGPKPPSLKQPG